MVNKESRQTDRIFHALSDGTRRSILERIARSDLSVAELREPFSISGPAISKHLKVLEKAGLIIRKVDGRQHRFEVNAQLLADAQQIISKLTSYWMKRLNTLDAFLKQDHNQPKK